MRNKLFKVFYYCFYLGLGSGIKILWKSFTAKKGKIVSYKVRGIKHPVYIRAKTSDEYTFRQIFLNKEYQFHYEGVPLNIVDAGANIGLAAVYFANYYPTARIICLEPETSNFQLLEKNIKSYPNIIALNAGLWSKKSYLKIKDEGLGNWGFTVEESDSSDSDAIYAISLPDLKDEYHLHSLDIVKMDIEGSEKDVLEAKNVDDWLSMCKVLVIELHDRMKKGTSAALFQALSKYDVLVEQKGENLICKINSSL